MAMAPSLVFSQTNLFVSGRVVDNKGGKPVSFANVVTLSNYKGTSSNLNGDFELKMKEGQRNDTIRITAVGYNTLVVPVIDYLNKDHTFVLEVAEYSLENVTVKAKSLLYYTILKRAMRKIDKNYTTTPVGYEVYYRNKKTVNNSTEKERQAALEIYDDRGYDMNTVFSAYVDIRYNFVQVKRDFKVNSFADASTRMDEMLEYDIVRCGQNILHTDTTHFVENFDVDLLKITEYEGDKVWVIKYACKNPNLALTGDYYTTKYSGKIFVKQKDYAVVKNITQVVSSNYSPLGRSMYIDATTQERKPASIEYQFISTYSQQGKKYYLKSVQCDRTHKWKAKGNGRMITESFDTDLMVSSVEVKSPKRIDSRAYYEETELDPEFWKSYNFLKDE